MKQEMAGGVTEVNSGAANRLYLFLILGAYFQQSTTATLFMARQDRGLDVRLPPAVPEPHHRPLQSQRMHPNVAAFTLIELSIVLVIIGLIAGGVLVGQNLIKAAQIRATLTQINKLNTAVNTFRDKFNGLPGDIPNYTGLGLAVPSSASGFPIATYVGNGLIEDHTGTGGFFSGEVTAFLTDLSRAQLLDNNNVVQYFLGVVITTNALATIMLPSPYGGGTFVWASKATCNICLILPSNIDQYNYWHIARITSVSGGGISDNLGITPIDAAGIDNKLDDGMPNTGNVLAYNTSTGAIDLAVGASKCSSASGVYDVAANPNQGECSLAFRAGF